MKRKVFQLADYTIEVIRSGSVVEIYAKTLTEDGKEVQSAICQVNGIASELLSDEEIVDGELLEESYYEFANITRAREIYSVAVEFFGDAEQDPEPRSYILMILDDDRAEGEWSSPSDKGG